MVPFKGSPEEAPLKYHGSLNPKPYTLKRNVRASIIRIGFGRYIIPQL